MRKEYSRSFAFAVVMHCILIGFLIYSFSQTIVPALPEEDPLQDTLEAVFMNPAPAPAQRLLKAEKVQEEVPMPQSEPKPNLEEQKKEEKKKEKLALEQVELERKVQEKKIEEQRLAEVAEHEKKIKQEKAALAKAEKEKAEKAAAAEKARKAEDQKRQAIEFVRKQDDERLQKLADAKLKEAMVANSPTGATNAVPQARMRQVTRNLMAQHAALIQAKIHKNWRQPLGVELKGMNCTLSVKLSTGGDVLEAVVVQSSGNKEYDRSTELAVMKSSPLPMPSDPQILSLFRKFTFTFNPGNV